MRIARAVESYHPGTSKVGGKEVIFFNKGEMIAILDKKNDWIYGKLRNGLK
eukprot:Pgem_evm1s17523